MRIKKILLLALLVAIPVFAWYLLKDRYLLTQLSLNISWTKLLPALVLSTLLLILAHVLRAFKTKVLTDNIKHTPIKVHVRALFIGYMFNILLPFRIGELIRAVVLGKATKLSSAFMFGLVIFDRAVDSLILGVLALLIITSTSVFDVQSVQTLIIISSSALIIVGSLLVALLLTLKKQPKVILNFWHSFTDLFNDDLRDSIRFKMWTLMYGLERVLNKKQLTKYLCLSLTMWAIYIFALFPVITLFLPDSQPKQLASVSTVSYLGVSAPAGPAHFGSYQPYIDASGAQNEMEAVQNALIVTWFIQIVPAFLIGLVFVLRTKETLKRLSRNNDATTVTDKLMRETDISKDIGPFLNSFFTGNSLSKIMHRFELENKGKLVRYFKGGSDAITALVYDKDKLIVRKVTPLQFKAKLKSQYDWLNDKKRLKNIVKTLGEETTDNYYKIDLRYNKDFIPFFDYIHTSPQEKSVFILEGLINYLFTNVYKPSKEEKRPADLEAYIEERCLAKIRRAAEVHDEIRGLLEYKYIIINGRKYLNLIPLLEKIKKSKKITNTLSTYRKCSIHGDPTIDNVLVSKKTDDFLLIDPNDNENEISGPVLDFGRMIQSLRYGYEFLNQDERRVEVINNKISFEVAASNNYAILFAKLCSLQNKFLTKSERASSNFHAAVLYSRMLTHRVVINPLNAAKYYAVSVIAFNDFMQEISND